MKIETKRLMEEAMALSIPAHDSRGLVLTLTYFGVQAAAIERRHTSMADDWVQGLVDLLPDGHDRIGDLLGVRAVVHPVGPRRRPPIWLSSGMERWPPGSRELMVGLRECCSVAQKAPGPGCLGGRRL